MKWLLRKDVAKRYTATQALDHVWFEKASIKDKVSQQVANSITRFTKKNKFRMAMVHLFKDNIDKGQKKKLEQQFKAMDKDGDGNVSKKEFMDFMSKNTSKTKEEIEMEFKNLDMDGDAQINFNELLTSITDFQMAT